MRKTSFSNKAKAMYLIGTSKTKIRICEFGESVVEAVTKAITLADAPKSEFCGEKNGSVFNNTK
jgi:hypothetical protein